MSTNRTTPNPINTDKYHADKVGQCVNPRTCSVVKARERHYAKSRARPGLPGCFPIRPGSLQSRSLTPEVASITATMNVADFVTKHGIKLTTTKVPFRADGGRRRPLAQGRKPLRL